MITVDCYDDLPTGSLGQLANVRKDAVEIKPNPDLQVGEEYPMIYGNPIIKLSDLGNESFAELLLLGENTQGFFRVYPDGEEEGPITIPYCEVNQSFEMDGYIIQNLWIYIEQDFDFNLDWQVFHIPKGWTYITVKIAFDEQTGALNIYDKNLTSPIPPMLALTTFGVSEVNQNAKNIVFADTPFTIHNAGLYEKQNTGWVLINRSNVWNPCTSDTPPPPPVETFNVLTEDGDTIVAEDGNNIIKE